LVLAWHRTYNVPYVIVRPTNNYGIGQYTEKLIPKAVKYLSLGRQVPLHMNGAPRRTWLHVEDTADAIIHIIKSQVKNEIYNISGNYETSNLDVVHQIINNIQIIDELYVTTDYEYHIDFDYQRAGADVRYSIDDGKLKALGWRPRRIFKEELPGIVSYYQRNFVW